MQLGERDQLLPPLRQWVAGSASTPEREFATRLEDPNTGEALRAQRGTAPRTVDRALDCAARTHLAGSWRSTPLPERAALLSRTAEAIRARTDAIGTADAITTGVPIRTTRAFAGFAAQLFEEAGAVAGHAFETATHERGTSRAHVRWEPVGPAALILPWNAPCGLAAHKLASALAAGACAILKPSEWAPFSCDLIAEAAHEAGIPAGVVQLVHGDADVARQLVADARIRAVTFTGGTKGGEQVAAACARGVRPVQLELGGNNALVVLEDADVQRAAEQLAHGMTSLNGQWCRAVGRILVHRSLADALLEATLAHLATRQLGDSLAENTDIGPLVHRQHHTHVREQVERLTAHGGTAHAHNALPDLAGNFVAPCIVTGCDPADTTEEIFGPVAALHAFEDDHEALALANGTPYGLAGYVFSGDHDRARRLAEGMTTGAVQINHAGTLPMPRDVPRAPWGLSGLNEEGKLETVRFFCARRVVAWSA